MNTIQEVTKSNSHNHHYCQTTYLVNGQAVINAYRCNQRQLSTSDMWQIQRSRKEVSGFKGNF